MFTYYLKLAKTTLLNTPTAFLPKGNSPLPNNATYRPWLPPIIPEDEILVAFAVRDLGTNRDQQHSTSALIWPRLPVGDA